MTHCQRRISKLVHPINHTFSSVRCWLVPFRQKFGENWKVVHRVLSGVRVGLNVTGVGRWHKGWKANRDGEKDNPKRS